MCVFIICLLNFNIKKQLKISNVKTKFLNDKTKQALRYNIYYNIIYRKKKKPAALELRQGLRRELFGSYAVNARAGAVQRLPFASNSAG